MSEKPKNSIASKVEIIQKKVANLERLIPVLVAASIVLSFIAGALWERVGNSGGESTSATSKTAVAQPTTAAGQAQAASKLTDLPGLAKQAGVDANKFKSCYEAKKYESRISSDQAGGTAAGVQGTPGTFITTPKGEMWFVPGAYPYEQIKAVIDYALGKGSEPQASQGITKLDSTKASKLPKLSDADHVRGDRNAKVKFIEYSDFECPFCIRFHTTVKQVEKDYAKDVAIVFRHFPLEQLHPNAKPAALASECVNELGGNSAFWKFVDLAFGV